MMQFLRRHVRVVVVVTALLVGCVYASRHFFLWQKLQETGQAYVPFTLAGDFDGVWAYGPRLHEILDRHWIVADTDTYEYRNHLPVYPFIPPLVQAPFLLVAGSLGKGLLYSDFFFSSLVFLLTFGLGRALFKRRLFAYFFSIVATLALYLPIWSTRLFADSPQHILKYFLPWSHLESTLLSRRESQMPDAVFLIGAAWALWRCIEQPGRVRIALAAALGALLVWVYPYYAAYVAFAAAVRFMIACVARDWSVAKRLVWIPMFVGLAFIASSSAAQQSGVPTWDLLLRQGIEFGHAVNWGAWKHDLMVAVLAAVLGVLGWRAHRDATSFGWCFLCAGFIGRNVQVMLGWNLQSDHWISRVGWFGVLVCWVMAVVWCGQAVARRYPALRRAAVPALIVFTLFSFARTTHGQWLFALQNAKNYTLPQEELDFFAKVDQIIEQDAVMITPAFSSAALVPLLTRGRIYVPRAQSTLAPMDEIQDRAFLLWNFFGLSMEQVERWVNLESNMRAHESWSVGEMGILWLFGLRYAPQTPGFYFSHKNSDELYSINPKGIELFVQAYDRQINKNPLSILSAPYRVDYVLWGPAERALAPDFEPKGHPELASIFTDGTRTLYRIQR